MGCRFCGAGDHFVRSLTADEIVGQVEALLNDTGIVPQEIKKLQVMFMSMGEPLLNYENLKNAIIRLYELYPNARLLISTAAPRAYENFEKLEELSKQLDTIGLQFSVHESTDENRKKLIPAPTMTLKEISETGLKWGLATGRSPYFNYCVHPGNDTQEDVDLLEALFDPSVWSATVSVICERDETIHQAHVRQRELTAAFMQKLLLKGFNTRMFDPVGQDDIGGGCGQLFHTQRWMKNHPEHIKKSAGFGREVRHMPQ
jgi:23S rRNA (adenine2503-C2)-methyltransferase